jgi:hypothetical protein
MAAYAITVLNYRDVYMPGYIRFGRQQDIDYSFAIRVNQFPDLSNVHRQKSVRQTESFCFLAHLILSGR